MFDEKKYAATISVIALLGFADASYLAIEHFLGKVPPCSVLGGCEFVTTSQYATILGVPVALLGALYYLSFLVAAALYFDQKKSTILFYAARFSVIGFLMSLYFVSLQLFVLKAICIYCMFSALTSTALFLVSGVYLLKRQKI